MSSEGGSMKPSSRPLSPVPAPAPTPGPPSPPVSPPSDICAPHPHLRDSQVQEDIKPPGPALASIDAANFHRGLISLKQMQERSFSLVNQALLRKKLVEEQIKVERDAEAENNNDNKSVNNNSNSSNGADDAEEAGMSFEEARRRFMSESQAGAGGRLAFSVENILAPGKFGRELDEDPDQFGEFGSGKYSDDVKLTRQVKQKKWETV